MAFNTKLQPLERVRYGATGAYPRCLVVEAGEKGFVVDSGYSMSDKHEFASLEQAVQRADVAKGQNKIYVESISVLPCENDVRIQIVFRNGTQHEVILKKGEYNDLPESSGGNATNVAVNFAQLAKAQEENGLKVILRAVADVTGASLVEDSDNSNISLERLEGVHRRAVIVQHDNTNYIFSSPEAKFDPNSIQPPRYPDEPTVFVIGRVPFKNVIPDYFDFILEHKAKYPDDRVYVTVSTDQVQEGYISYLDLLKVTDILFCNLDEACDFLRLFVPNEDPANREKLAHMATQRLMRLGVKKVCITDALNGMFYAEKIDVQPIYDISQHTLDVQPKNITNQPLSELDRTIGRFLYEEDRQSYALFHCSTQDIRALQDLLREAGCRNLYFSDNDEGDCSIEKLSDIGTSPTGCGDSVTGIIAYLDYLGSLLGIRPELRGKVAMTMGLLMSKVKFSNLRNVNPKVLEALLDQLEICPRDEVDAINHVVNITRARIRKVCFDNVHSVHQTIAPDAVYSDNFEVPSDTELEVFVLVGARATGKTHLTHIARSNTDIAAEVCTPRRHRIRQGSLLSTQSDDFIEVSETDVSVEDLVAPVSRYDETRGYTRQSLCEAGLNAKKILLQSSTSNLAPLVQELEEKIFPEKRIHITILLLDAPRSTLMERIISTTEIDLKKFVEFLKKKALEVEDKTAISSLITKLGTLHHLEYTQEGTQFPGVTLKELSNHIQEIDPDVDNQQSALRENFDSLVLEYLLDKGLIHRQQVIGLERDRLQFIMTHPDLHERTIVLANTEDIDVSTEQKDTYHGQQRSTAFLRSLLRMDKDTTV